MPDPSHTEFSGDSRNSSGIPDSSTYPLPPRHSSASATIIGVRLHTQNFASGSAIRRSAASCGSSRVVDGGGEPQRQHGGRLGLHGQVGDHVLHQRLVGQQPTERRPVRDVPRRLGQRAPHQRRRAEHAVQPGRRDHLDDRPDAAALVAEPLRPGAVGTPARTTRSTGCPACPSAARRRAGCAMPSARTRGTRKQVSPSGAWASTRNTSFIGADVNHLCPSRVYSPVRRGRGRGRDVGPHVGAALLLGHPHAGQDPGLLTGRPQPRVVGRGGEPRGPLLGDRVVGAQRRHRGVRHRDRAAVPGSVWDQAKNPAARRTWACGSSEVQGAAWRPKPTPRSISQCHDGWNRTSSTGCP